MLVISAPPEDTNVCAAKKPPVKLPFPQPLKHPDDKHSTVISSSLDIAMILNIPLGSDQHDISSTTGENPESVRVSPIANNLPLVPVKVLVPLDLIVI